MMEWSESGLGGGGGGYFNETEVTTPKGKSGAKPVFKQQFLCPVTIRQVLEAPEEGLTVGEFNAGILSLVGVVISLDVTSTKMQFTLSDDTGVIDCVEWLESDDEEHGKNLSHVVEKSYYQVFGSLKTLHGQRRIMVFKVMKIQNFNEYTAFLAEVMCAKQYAEKFNDMPLQPTIPIESNYSSYKNPSSYDDHRTAFNPVQRAVFDAIKSVENQIGWYKNDTAIKSKFSTKQIEDALDFLISEGHIYSTVDDEHFAST